MANHRSISRYLNRLLIPIRERKFLYSYYEDFLKYIADTDKYQVVPLKDFVKTNSTDKVVIAMRHDIDHDLSSAMEMARLEHKYSIRATYFILHTAGYYGITQKKYAMHNQEIIAILQKMQNEYGHEIGWHNDLLTIECIYEINPKEYLQQELSWLRDNGIKVSGTASHGSSYCHEFKYINYVTIQRILAKCQ